MNNHKKILELLEGIKQQLESTPGLSDSSANRLESALKAAADILKPRKTISTGNSEIHIWSDGACSGNPGPGGWGTIVSYDDEYLELSGFSPKTTNNIMEMTGALEGIRRTPPGCRLVLTSDSQYLVKGMTQWIKGWKRKNWKKADGKPVLNKSIWMELDREAGLRDIQWKWIKGHAGHEENERCDELARYEITRASGR